MINCGIYRIECLVNHRVYFGSSVKLSQRLIEHRCDLKYGHHHNKHLQADWDLYGPDAFVFKILIRYKLSKFKLTTLENLYLHSYWDGQVQCYNIAKDAQASRRGRKHTQETKDKMSEASKGVPKSRAHCESLSVAHMGYKHTPEQKSKISDANTGRVKSPEECKRISIGKKGKSVPWSQARKDANTKRKSA